MTSFVTRKKTATFPASMAGGGPGEPSRIRFTCSAPLMHQVSGEIFEETLYAYVDPATGVLYTQAGAWITLACNDDPNVLPVGTVWMVYEEVQGSVRREYSILVSVADTDPDLLAHAIHVTGGTVSYGITDLTSADASVVITTPSAGIRDLRVIGGGGGGSGTVTSVGLSMPSDFSVANSPITGAGTLVVTANTQAANVVKAGPTSGIAAAPTYRALVAADLPAATTGAQGAAILATPSSDVTAGHVVQANDARLSDARTPTAHHTTHNTGGTDPIAPGDIGAAATANNLSDLANAGTARTNLGLGLVATLLGAVARLIISKAGTVIGTRRQLNFIEGTGVTLTVADDGTNEKVDITIAASGGGGATFPLQSAGGNARGTQATDLQTTRAANTQVASGNYSALGGGENNTASGTDSTVGGGNGNTASAQGATVSGGAGNTANTYMATVAGGNGNSAVYGGVIGGGVFNTDSGDYGTIAGGLLNAASGDRSTVGGGASNTASGDYATVPGGTSGKAILYGQLAHAAGQFAAAGDAQESVLLARAATTDATATELFLNGSAARLTLAAGRASSYQILVIARKDDGTAVGGWKAEGVMNRVTAGNIALSGNSVTALGTPPTGWDFGVSADTTNQSLKLLGTGAASTNVHWVARLILVEVV